MLSHILVLFFRNLRRFTGSFLINIIGLSTGLASVLLIYLWASDEIMMDRFHLNDSRLYQVMTNESTDKGIVSSEQTQQTLASILQAEFPEVEASLVATPPAFFPPFTIVNENEHVKANGKFVGEAFFTMFSFPLISGSAGSVLSDKGSVVLSETLAEKLFGTTHNIVGRSLDYDLFQIHKPVIVSGVFQDIPSNASETFDFVLPFSAFEEIMGFTAQSPNWKATGPFQTYVLLKPGVDSHDFDDKVRNFIRKKDAESNFTLFTRPFSDRYLYASYKDGVQQGGRIGYVRIFLVTGIGILLLACVNFMNLSTAKATRRVREVAIKKTIGAGRGVLILQYFSEALMVSLFSMMLAIALVQGLLPHFNVLVGKQLVMVFDWKFYVGTGILVMITGFIAGFYPALYLSGFRSSAGLKGIVHGSFAELIARRGLVVFQFAVAVVFITSILVIHAQMKFVQNKNLGYEKENLMYLEVDGKLAGNVKGFLEAVRELPGIVNASSMLGNIAGESGGRPGVVTVNGKAVVVHSTAVNYGLLETLDVKLKEGRTFSEALDADTMKVVLNEAAVNALGLVNPIGQKMPGTGSEIIGVVTDFHFHSLYQKVEPHSFRLEPYYALTIMVRMKPGTEAETLGAMEGLYEKFNPGYTFDYKFLDQQFARMYAAEARVEILSTYAATLAILISCLGLMGLVGYAAERRLKEICIRKVLGSSHAGVLWLLSADFCKLIVAAVFIGLPVSYYLITAWLDTFAYHISQTLFYFVAGIVIALTVAALTIGLQSFRVVRANIVKGLKNE